MNTIDFFARRKSKRGERVRQKFLTLFEKKQEGYYIPYYVGIKDYLEKSSVDPHNDDLYSKDLAKYVRGDVYRIIRDFSEEWKNTYNSGKSSVETKSIPKPTDYLSTYLGQSFH